MSSKVVIVMALLILGTAVSALPALNHELITDQVLRPPSWLHPFGTDHLGRDVLQRVAAGARYSLGFAIGPVVIGAAVGIPLGLAAGLGGKVVDGAISTVVNVLMALPDLVVALCLAAALGPGYGNVITALGISLVPQFIRLTRNSTLAVKPLPFIEAAVAAGCPTWALMVRHILPNIAGPLVALAAYRTATSVLSGSALSFLGMGVRPPTPEWGAMMAGGRSYLRQAWWLCTFPGLAIFVLALSAQAAGATLSRRRGPSVH